MTTARIRQGFVVHVEHRVGHRNEVPSVYVVGDEPVYLNQQLSGGFIDPTEGQKQAF